MTIPCAALRSVLVAVLLGVLPAARGEAQLTLRGGVNLTTFVGGDAEDVESRKGLNLGAAIPLFHLGPIAIVPEIYYAQKGADRPTPGLGLVEFSLDYIEVPVLARLNLGGGMIRPYLQAGPSFAWQLDCSLSLSTIEGDEGEDCGETLNEELRDYDQGIVFGGGVDFGFAGIGALNLDARFERGLARITKNGEDVKNQAFTLMLGWQLGGGGMLR